MDKNQWRTKPTQSRCVCMFPGCTLQVTVTAAYSPAACIRQCRALLLPAQLSIYSCGISVRPLISEPQGPYTKAAHTPTPGPGASRNCPHTCRLLTAAALARYSAGQPAPTWVCELAQHPLGHAGRQQLQHRVQQLSPVLTCRQHQQQWERKPHQLAPIGQPWPVGRCSHDAGT